jgi:nucleotide-binding universal stress UspA family protein
MKTIVALVDFSDVTTKVIKETEAMAKALNARVVLLHSVPKEPVVIDLGLLSPTVTGAPNDRKKDADYAKLLDLRDSLASSGVDVAVQQLEDGKSESILAHCDQMKADMVIVGAHHHNGFYKWLIGTCTTQVLHRARYPVLVVPAD